MILQTPSINWILYVLFYVGEVACVWTFVLLCIDPPEGLWLLGH